MDLVVLLQELETVGFVPSLRDNIEGNLTTNQVHEVVFRKLLLENLDHLLTNMVLLVIKAKGITLLLRTIATDRTDVEHSRTELDEGTSLHGDTQLTNIAQDKVDELVQLFIRIYIRNVLDLIAIHKKYGFVELLAIMVGGKTVLRKHVLDFVSD